MVFDSNFPISPNLDVLHEKVAVGPDGIRRFKEKALVSYVFYSDGVHSVHTMDV